MLKTLWGVDCPLGFMFLMIITWYDFPKWYCKLVGVSFSLKIHVAYDYDLVWFVKMVLQIGWGIVFPLGFMFLVIITWYIGNWSECHSLFRIHVARDHNLVWSAKMVLQIDRGVVFPLGFMLLIIITWYDLPMMLCNVLYVLWYLGEFSFQGSCEKSSWKTGEH